MYFWSVDLNNRRPLSPLRTYKIRQSYMSKIKKKNLSPCFLQPSVVWLSEDCASWYILIMKAKEMNYFSDLFDKVFYMFRTYPLSIIRSISDLFDKVFCMFRTYPLSIIRSISDLFYKVFYMFQTYPLSIIRSISKLYTRNRYLPW